MTCREAAAQPVIDVPGCNVKRADGSGIQADGRSQRQSVGDFVVEEDAAGVGARGIREHSDGGSQAV